MNKFIDISWPITENMTAYKDRKVVEITPTKMFSEDGAREHKIIMGTHSGTHVDAPAHFIEKGSNVDSVSLDKLNGTCRVLDLTKVKEKITLQDLQPFNVQPGEILLLKTSNSALRAEDSFKSDFIYLDAAGAAYLAGQDIKCVGIDYLGVERSQPKHETHMFLLEKNIPIIEGLRLNALQEGKYTLHCLPLNILGVEAAPVRAVVTQN